MTDFVATTLTIVCLVLAVPAVLASAYLLLLTLLSASLPTPARSSRQLRFDLLVPAHNEEQVIERTVASLRKLDWPTDRFRLIVIADNCTDTTAALARAAGAQVWERENLQFRGKGYALEHAFKLSLSEGWAQAVVIVDADTEASENLLEAFAARIERGSHAIQAHYGVLNPTASWRTRLMTIAMVAFHIVRSRGRERLGASCGIRGNGWCLTQAALKHVPYAAYSLAEDIEYGIELGFRNYRIAYADEAHVHGEMVSKEQAAGNQRRRWEQGRFQLIRSKTLPLLITAFRRGSLVCLDLALDLLVLPLSYVALNVATLLAITGVLTWLLPMYEVWLWISVACATSLVIYVLRGWQLSGTGKEGLKDLARAPKFLVWTLLLMLRRSNSKEWVRTDREGS